jgi:L-threonylcarbamoyladenylate synthase
MNHSKIYSPTDTAIELAAQCLARGELVGIPTETVYGLAACAFNPDAVAKIYAAKGRPSNNPLIIHLADVSQLPLVTADPLDDAIAAQIDLLAVLWPGPMTLVLPRSPRVPDAVTAGRDTVAVRVPGNEITRRLIRKCGFPLAAPSANRSTYVSPTTAMHVWEGLGEHVSMILDGGACDCGIESTIVMLQRDGATMLRPGVITREELSLRLGAPVHVIVRSSDPATSDDDTELAESSLIAPGMMREHYAPTTPIQFVDASRRRGLPPRCGRIAFKAMNQDEASSFEVVRVLSEHGDLNEVARHLFASIRELDGLGLNLIVVDTCEPIGIGQAIMDRLNRATARSA